MMVYFVDEAPTYQEGQPRDRDPKSKALTEEKLQKVIDRGYLENKDLILSLTSFFSVPKGETDIRMVYDGTKCGLNGSVWVPTFYMPTLASHLRAVVEGTHMCDVDIGEMFLNFMLHPTLRVLCGVDLSNYDLNLSSLDVPVDPAEVKTWVSWNRIAMGLKWSPYQAIKGMHFAEEVIRGNRKDPDNVYRWDRVRLNLPGQPDYEPALPWVSKVKILEDGSAVIAADLHTFMDDMRPCGATKKEGWLAGRKAASIINWLGCQDASRKRRDSRQDPGSWAGCVVRTEGGVFALVSEDKWIKAKSQITELEDLLDSQPETLPRKRLEQIRGFLGYITQTYRYMIPYLNGLHITIDGWRRNRDPDGWKLPASKQGKRGNAKSPADRAREHDTEEEEIPALVQAKPRLFSDIAALLALSEADAPPWRLVRPKHSSVVTYGFGDASGSAYGGASQVAGADEFHFQFGQWTARVSGEESSNWREFTNLVEYLEERDTVGMLKDSEVFMSTIHFSAGRRRGYWRSWMSPDS